MLMFMSPTSGEHVQSRVESRKPLLSKKNSAAYLQFGKDDVDWKTLVDECFAAAAALMEQWYRRILKKKMRTSF